jgi:hypothetical protein
MKITEINMMMEYQSPKSDLILFEMQVLCLSNPYDGNVDDLDREDIENW